MKKFKHRNLRKRRKIDGSSILAISLILSMVITTTIAFVKKNENAYVSANDYQQDATTLTAGVSRQIQLELGDGSSANDYQQDATTLTAGVSRQIQLGLGDGSSPKSPEIQSNDIIPVTTSSMLGNNEETAELTTSDNNEPEIVEIQDEIETDPIDIEYADVEFESDFDPAYYEDYGEYITTITRYDEKYVPSGYGKVHTYMGWQCITNKSSQQYKLRMAAQNFDDEGFGKIGDRYAVAMKPYYGEIGDYLDITQTDGSVYKVVIVDYKGKENGNSGTSRYIHHDGSIIEFVVDKGMWYSKANGGWNSKMHTNPGTRNFHPELGLNISKITNVGNYWDYDHDLMKQQ